MKSQELSMDRCSGACMLRNQLLRDGKQADWYSGIKEYLCYTISAPPNLPKE
jgi:hypothetical protein